MPTPRALLRFVVHRLDLQRYLAKPGDGRKQPVIPARAALGDARRTGAARAPRAPRDSA
jgi:hypothetical protein